MSRKIAQSRPFLEGSSKKIAIALSGGVDSSVVAYLMKQKLHQERQRQHELVAVHMSNWNTSDEEDPYCTRERDWKDAQAVAKQLDIPIHPTSFAAEYWTQVFEPFSEGVEKGNRPNPDVHCNRYIKFGALREFVQSTLKADLLATGHYARLWDRMNRTGTAMPEAVQQMLEEDTDALDWILSWGKNKSDTLAPLLLAARDRSKCQSFFLSNVPGNAFHNVIFPLGDLQKKNKKSSSKVTVTAASNEKQDLTVRELAVAANLPTASKKDSMGICFIGKRPGGFTDFIDQYFPTVETEPYHFVDVDTGKFVQNEFGESTTNHMVYTRGQRAKISGASKAWFVVKTDKKTRSIIVCKGTHHPALYTDVLYVRDLHWIAGDIPSPLKQLSQTTSVVVSHSHSHLESPPVLHAMCRVRNLQALVKCQITYQADSNVYEVRTEKPLRAITPGQHCAIYVGKDGLVCLGGGTILERGESYHDLNRELNLEDLHPAGHNDLSVDKEQHKWQQGQKKIGVLGQTTT